MNGFERLKEQVEGQKDKALIQTVDYLLTRDDLSENYLKEDKNIQDMAKYIKSLGQKYIRNGWNYITDELVYAWAVMYFSLPNEYLKIKSSSKKENTTPKKDSKNNVISLEEAKKNIKKDEVKQISLFGGEKDE